MHRKGSTHTDYPRTRPVPADRAQAWMTRLTCQSGFPRKFPEAEAGVQQAAHAALRCSSESGGRRFPGTFEPMDEPTLAVQEPKIVRLRIRWRRNPTVLPIRRDIMTDPAWAAVGLRGPPSPQSRGHNRKVRKLGPSEKVALSKLGCLKIGSLEFCGPPGGLVCMLPTDS